MEAIPTPHPPPCPVNLPHPQVCCPLDRSAFKISLRPWCSWGGKCWGRGRWCPSRAASSLRWVLWVRGWRGCAKGFPDPSVPGVSPFFPHFTFLGFFFFFPLPWRHRLKNGKSSLKWLFSCKPFRWERLALHQQCLFRALQPTPHPRWGDTPPPPKKTHFWLFASRISQKGPYFCDHFAPPPSFLPIPSKGGGPVAARSPRVPLLQCHV